MRFKQIKREFCNGLINTMKMVQNLYYKSLTEYYGLSAGICALNPNLESYLALLISNEINPNKTKIIKNNPPLWKSTIDNEFG